MTETVEIVIKIPKQIYEKLDDPFDEMWNHYLVPCGYAIRNGIVLPKGHGRLIDAGMVKQKIFDITELYDSGKYLVFEDCKYLIGDDIQNDNRRVLSLNEALQGVINGMIANIEADTESEVDND